MNKVQLILKSKCSRNTIKAFPHAESAAGWRCCCGQAGTLPAEMVCSGAATSRAESGPCPSSVPQETEKAFSPTGSVISNRN